MKYSMPEIIKGNVTDHKNEIKDITIDFIEFNS